MKVDLKNEWWLAKRIYGTELCTLFYGISDMPTRRALMRAMIIKRGLQETMINKSTVTFARGFERLYGEALVPHE